MVPVSKGRPMARAGAVFLCSLLALAFVPSATADHPDSNLGMVRYLMHPDVMAGRATVDQVVTHLADVELAFREWEAAYPDLVERLSIGATSSGAPLLGIRITDESVASDAASLSTGQKLRVYLDGGHHGNEFLGVDLIMYFLEDVLVKAAAGDPDTLAFLSDTELYAVPIINVDGNTADTRKNSNLVDPNRNYPFGWGGEGAGDSVDSFTYRGPEAMSEAEVANNVAFATELMPQAWVTMHSGIAEFYWPWGNQFDRAPDWMMFESLEEPFEAVTNGRVDAMQAAELYLAAGATDDFGYGALGIPTFTYEVHEDQFIPIYGQGVPTILADQLDGLWWILKEARYLGAWLEPTFASGVLVLENLGRGNATNVAIDLGGSTVVAPDIASGSSFTLSLDAATLDEVDVAHVTYDVLYIETTPQRTHSVVLSDPSGAAQITETTPAPAMLASMLVAALVLLVVAGRRL